MSVIADYSSARPYLHALKAAGAEGMQRYLPPLPNQKVNDVSEFQAALTAGPTVTLVSEWYNQRALGDKAAGTVDGAEAARHAHRLGYTGVGYAVLEDPTTVHVSLWPAIDAFEHFLGQVDEDAVLKPDYGPVPRPADIEPGGPMLPQMAAPICAGVVRPQQDGYWLVGRDGGIFNFGGAPPFGPSLVIPDSPHEIIDPKCTGTRVGLFLSGADGGVFTFGDAVFAGSLPSILSPSSLPPRG